MTPTNKINLQLAAVLERTTSSRINAEPRWACARQPREAARDHTTVVQMLLEIDEELEETGYDHNNDDQCLNCLAIFLCYSKSGNDQKDNLAKFGYKLNKKYFK